MSDGPIRVLCVFSTLNRGGAETMCMNLYRHIDRNRVQFDFVKHTPERGTFEDEIESLGGRVYEAPRYKIYNQLQYESWWRNHLKSHPEHQIVHGHFFTISAVYFRVCKRMGRITIGHIHASASDGMVKEFLERRISAQADHAIACSLEAGRWIYGERPFMVLKNAVDVEVFRYDPEVRAQMRKELGLDDVLTLGTVANFSSVKNPMGLLDVFESVCEYAPEARLVWVGEGGLRAAIEQRIVESGLEGRVTLLGSRGDVPQLLQAIDVFVFPSFSEGLGMAVIEAQASGLPVFCSAAVPREVNVTGRCAFLPLGNTSMWTKAILKADLGHQDTYQTIVDAGYDIRTTVAWLQEFYLRVAHSADGEGAGAC